MSTMCAVNIGMTLVWSATNTSVMGVAVYVAL